MGHWKVPILGEGEALRRVAQEVQFQGFRLVEDQSVFFLVGLEDTARGDPLAFTQEIERICDALSGATRMAWGSVKRFSVGTPIFVEHGGQTVFIHDTIRVSDTVTVTVTDQLGSIVSQTSSRPPADRLMQLAARDKHVADALSLLGKADLTFRELGIIYDMVKLRDPDLLETVDKKWRDRFQWTMNSYDIAGVNSRHGPRTERDTRRVAPVPLEEAIHMIEHLANNWFQRMLAGPLSNRA